MERMVNLCQDQVFQNSPLSLREFRKEFFMLPPEESKKFSISLMELYEFIKVVRSHPNDIALAYALSPAFRYLIEYELIHSPIETMMSFKNCQDSYDEIELYKLDNYITKYYVEKNQIRFPRGLLKCFSLIHYKGRLFKVMKDRFGNLEFDLLDFIGKRGLRETQTRDDDIYSIFPLGVYNIEHVLYD